MPTMPASAATLPRIVSAIARTRASGSGRGVLTGVGVVKVALQDDRGGDGVDVALSFRARALAGEARLGRRGGERLVHHHDGDAVFRLQAAREFLGELRDRVLRIVFVARPSHDEARGMPLVDELADLPEARNVGRRVDRAQRIGDARARLAYPHANAPLTEVEPAERAGGGAHACPASSERLAV